MPIFENFKASFRNLYSRITNSGEGISLTGTYYPQANDLSLSSSPVTLAQPNRGRYDSFGNADDTEATDKIHYSAQSSQVSTRNGRSVDGADEQPTPEPIKWCGLSLFGRAGRREEGREEGISLRHDINRYGRQPVDPASASAGNGNSTEDSNTQARNLDTDFGSR